MNDLVKKFCTPPYLELTGFDQKSITGSKKTYIDFDGMQIPIYSWGEEKKFYWFTDGVHGQVI